MALTHFEISEGIDNTNPMTKYQKANVHIGLKQFDLALRILQNLCDIMPKEAPIHIQIGKVHRTLKNYSKALHHFQIALDLDPKDANMAKALIEKLYADDSFRSDI